VTLVLVNAAGEVLGHLPPFEAATPWWQDAGPVVRGARERFGLDLIVLRLLETEPELRREVTEMVARSLSAEV